MTPPTTSTLNNAANIRWDLGSIYASAAAAAADLDLGLKAAMAFAAQYRGRVAALNGATLAGALDQLATVHTVSQRAARYAFLRSAVDATNDANRDLVGHVDRVSIEIANHLRFFDLEWQALPKATAAALSSSPEVAGYRHHLELMAANAQHMRSEAEEAMLAERLPAAVSEWQMLFSETLATLVAPFDGGDSVCDHTIDGLLAYVHDSRRDVRIRALDTLYAALQPWSNVLAKCYDALVGDRLAMDRLRDYATPMQPANIDNDLDDAVVNGLIAAVEAHYPLAQRWFRAKAKQLGLDRLALADQYAPLGTPRRVDFVSAQALLRQAVERFSPRAWEIMNAAFDEGRVDAEPRKGKRGGAFCEPVSADDQPFMLMNYTDSLDDVGTLAHEMGHLLHFSLSASAQNQLTYETGMAMAEVASTFNEMLLFDLLMETETDAETRRALLASRVESSFATVFRQTMMASYERLAYAAKAAGSALSPDRLSEHWLTQNQIYYGDSVDLPEGYRLGWSYIPHFIDTRFYTYSYSFAHLASLTLYAHYREQGESFVEPYLDLLSAGGAKAPAELLAGMGIDISAASWVDAGFVEMERMVALAENA